MWILQQPIQFILFTRHSRFSMKKGLSYCNAIDSIHSLKFFGKRRHVLKNIALCQRFSKNHSLVTNTVMVTTYIAPLNWNRWQDIKDKFYTSLIQSPFSRHCFHIKSMSCHKSSSSKALPHLGSNEPSAGRSWPRRSLQTLRTGHKWLKKHTSNF